MADVREAPAFGRTESVASNDSSSAKPNEKKKTRRPANTAFRQQRLKAWQPILTPKTVLPLFFIIGIIFAPIGGILLYASAQVQELRLEYTDCRHEAPVGDFGPMPSDRVHASFKTADNITALWKRDSINRTFDGEPLNTTRCFLQFNIPESMGPPVLFYYHLTNFYQNHRRYVKSFFDKQLKGDKVDQDAVNASDCDPLRSGDWVDGKTKMIYPCGLIANSLFNDTFTSPLLLDVPHSHEKNRTYYMSQTGIAWDSDKALYGKYGNSLDEIIPPPNWQDRYPHGYTENNPPPILDEDEAFMVWMRTAGLPDFSKLARRNDTTAMIEGNYILEIDDNFPAFKYKGTKSVVFSTRTVMGGKNPFLGIAYIVVGGICIVLGVVFTVTHLVKPRKLGDHTYLSWNNAPKNSAPGTAAAASGRDFGRPGEA